MCRVDPRRDRLTEDVSISWTERSIRMTTAPHVPGAPVDTYPSRAADWIFAQRVAFRFVLSFLVLCVFPFPFSTSPGSVYRTMLYDKMWFVLASWIGSHILHLPPTPSSFSSYLLADTIAGYVTLFCFVVLSVLATIVWTLLDRKRMEYRTLHEWLRIYVRYALAFTMLAYGMDKIFALQFSWSLPGPGRLAEPLGNYSPFALMWTFMGYSTGYTIFAGAGEVIGGVLLFFRRTTTLGALILCGVMANVVALNFCYGVPVKIFSSVLLLMAIFLVAPDAKRLLRVFVLNRPAPALKLAGPFPRQWMARSRLALNAAIVIFSLYWFTGPALQFARVRANPPKPPIYGLYQVESFTQNEKPLTQTDGNWRCVIFEDMDSITVLAMDDSMHYYGIHYDVSKATVTISGEYDQDSGEEKGIKSTLAYSRPDAGHLELRGNFNNLPVMIEMRKVNTSRFTLVSRGFHWSENGGYYR
jgi:multidrug transporter EmrE-like cation transporter